MKGRCCAICIFYTHSCQIAGGYASDRTMCHLPLGSTISNNILPEISNSNYCNKWPNPHGLTSDNRVGQQAAYLVVIKKSSLPSPS